jgi:hypothetical protein
MKHGPSQSQTLPVVLTALVLLTGAGLWLGWPRYYRPCGHKMSWLELHYPEKFGGQHFCMGRGVIHDLEGLHRARDAYLKHHDGEEATSILTVVMANLYEFPFRDPECYHLECSGSGADWVCRVARTMYLPGNYVMTADGRIFFSQDHPATAADVPLEKLR